MVGKLGTAGILVLLLSTALVGAVYAEEEIHPPQVRVLGEITAINLEENTFAFTTRQGENLRFLVIERTRFRSRDGSINGLGDLEAGMMALVVGIRHPENGLVALMVAAGKPDDLPETFRLKGRVDGVDLYSSTFSVLAVSGESQRFKVIDRTQFRSRDGSVKGLQDLEIGMPLNVFAAKTDDGIPVAVVVIAGLQQTKPERFEGFGEITNVVPGLNKFDLQTRSGELLEITVSDRTRFRSRDGSIEDIHDLKKGMHALVAGVRLDDGQLKAVIVGVGQPRQDRAPRTTDVERDRQTDAPLTDLR